MKKELAGRISKPFGQDGGLVVNLYEAFPAQPGRDEPVWTVIDSLDVPLYLEEFSRRGRTSAVVRFADIDTPRRAAMLVGREIFIAGEAEEEEGDDALIGFTAHLGGGVQGIVEDLFDEGPNPLFRIMAGKREYLVPAAEELIEKVDERRREIWFALPEGLLDING